MVTNQVELAPLELREIDTQCPPGLAVLSGGYQAQLDFTQSEALSVTGSMPMHVAGGTDYWALTVANHRTNTAVALTVSVTCAAITNSS